VNFRLVNRSVAVSERQLAAMAAAIQTQMNRDVMPSWRRDGVIVAAGGAAAPGDLVITLVDHLDDAAVLGYHDESPEGVIGGIIGVQAIIACGGGVLAAGASGDSVSAVVSHEVIEAKFDPNANLYADMLAAGGAFKGFASMAFELCDPVQSSGYEINGVFVSNFVLPSYFDPSGPGPWDYLRHLRGPFSLEAGGYAIVRTAPGDERSIFAAVSDARPWRSHGRMRKRCAK
jgi:hypothetical protein